MKILFPDNVLWIYPSLVETGLGLNIDNYHNTWEESFNLMITKKRTKLCL